MAPHPNFPKYTPKMTSSSKGNAMRKIKGAEVLKLLVVGETGSGKSTFINMLTNYFRDGSLTSPKIAIPTKFHRMTEHDFPRATEEDVSDASKSQTNACLTYEMTPTFHVIDTPGLNDTRGRERDDLNIKLIVDAAEKARSIAAIVVLINGTESRETLSMRNLFHQLKGNLPDAVMQNILVVLTKCTRDVVNFQVNNLTTMFPAPIVYYMQNSAFATDPRTWSSTRGQMRSWKRAMRTLKSIEDRVKLLGNVCTAEFSDMRDLRNIVKSRLHEAKAEIQNLQALHDEIAQFRVRKVSAEQAKELYKEFKRTTTVDEVQFVDKPYHSTICQTCNFVCHDHCGLNETNTVGDHTLTGCACMGSDGCSRCPGRCGHRVHYHSRKQPVKTSATIEEEVEELKQQYEGAVEQYDQCTTMLQQKAMDQAVVEQSIQDTVKDVEDACRKLQKICRGFNLVNELHDTLEMMRTEASMLNSTEARKAAEETIRSVQGVADALQNTQTKVTGIKGKIVEGEEPYDDDELDSGDDDHDTQSECGESSSDEEVEILVPSAPFKLVRKQTL